MAQSPMPPGSYFLIQKMDEDDPETNLEAFLVLDDHLDDTQWRGLGNSFGASFQEEFVWLVKSAAEFHGRLLVNESGVEA